MTEADIIASMKKAQADAEVLKAHYVDLKKIEIAAKWRDAALALGRAIDYVTPKKKSGVKVQLVTTAGEWQSK